MTVFFYKYKNKNTLKQLNFIIPQNINSDREL